MLCLTRWKKKHTHSSAFNFFTHFACRFHVYWQYSMDGWAHIFLSAYFFGLLSPILNQFCLLLKITSTDMKAKMSEHERMVASEKKTHTSMSLIESRLRSKCVHTSFRLKCFFSCVCVFDLAFFSAYIVDIQKKKRSFFLLLLLK